jgi:hypothetical protein
VVGGCDHLHVELLSVQLSYATAKDVLHRWLACLSTPANFVSSFSVAQAGSIEAEKNVQYCELHC